MVRLLVYSNQPMLVKGLESVLMKSDGFEILPVCTTICGILDQMKAAQPDLALMDLTAEVTFAVLSEINQAVPAAKLSSG